MTPARAVSRLAPISLLALAGCSRPAEPVDVATLARRPAESPALDRPLNAASWSRSVSRPGPLDVASAIAASAGGDWMAIAPKNLDPIKWRPTFPGGMPAYVIGMERAPAQGAVQAALESLAREKPTAWELRDGRMLLYFDSADELAHSRVHPPQTVLGVYLRAHSAAGMLAMVGSFWHLKLTAHPAMLRRRDALLAMRRGESQPVPQGMMSVFSGAMMRGATPPQTIDEAPALSLRMAERVTGEEVLKRVAAYLGGEAVPPEGDALWRVQPFTQEAQTDREVKRLLGVIADGQSRDRVVVTTNSMTSEKQSVIVAPDEIVDAVESLAALGPRATAALAGCMDASHPGTAQAAIRALAAIGGSDTTWALLNFARKLETTPPAGNRDAAPALAVELVRALRRDRGTAAGAWLARTATSVRMTAALRAEARRALAESGRLGLIAVSRPAALWPPRPFALTIRPDGTPGDTAADATKPLATCSAPDGSRWAVFLSGRYGNKLDFWLAHGRGRDWTEFLFTGKQFPRGTGYYDPRQINRMPQPGCLALAATADVVRLLPPAADTTAGELAKAMSALRARNQKPMQRQQAISRYQMLVMRQRDVLHQPIELKLGELRRDGDGDGVPDLVEQRLGTDPQKSDTTGDGVLDGRDENPLAPRTPPGDRQRVLQELFSALYAGDPDPSPLFVILDRPYWQPFHGAGAPVLCCTREEYRRRLASLQTLRALEFGGPGDARSTILNLDGPCAFDSGGRRAEVHFWQWRGRSLSAMPWMFMWGADSSAIPVDMVATFTRSGSQWRLEGIRPWREGTVDSALVEMLRGLTQ